MDQAVQAIQDLVDRITRLEQKTVDLQNDLWSEQEENRKLRIVHQLNFLRHTDIISKMEYATVIEMLISPDAQNNYMAKQIIKTKIENSNWEQVMMSLYE